MKERGNQVAKVFQQQKLRTLKKLNKTIKKFRPSLKGKEGGRERERQFKITTIPIQVFYSSNCSN